MNQFLEAVTNKGYTDNGALTNLSSKSPLVDLMFLAGASRRFSDEEYFTLLNEAYSDNPKYAIRLMFWAGDIRESLGERKFFSKALRYLYDNHLPIFEAVAKKVPEYSRWDLLFPFHESEVVMSLIAKEFCLGKDGLLFKWLPREKCKKHKIFRLKLLRRLNIDNKTYRKIVSEKSDTVEQQMSAKNWQDINYKHVPSVAFSKYKKAFYRNDEDRFADFVNKANKGETTINAGAIFPYQIVAGLNEYSNSSEWEAAEAQWKNLPDYLEDAKDKILPLIDLSGSMTCSYGSNVRPIDVATSLGVYMSERLPAPFKNTLAVFSQKPNFLVLPEGSLKDKLKKMWDSSEVANTNFYRVFTFMLAIATQNKVPKEDMPNKIMAISDMEFDEAQDYGHTTNFQEIKKLYEDSGYDMPDLVFWNVNGRLGNAPATINDKGVILISGCSPSILKFVLNGGCDSLKLMQEIVESPRYSAII
ncbi:DUF2828 family protein [Cognatishimia sp.]|uniref:DUF2828 family protein n=1 Tax=Cognatishimia sp. TaxID=2211648 RepID=UPI003513AFA9|nr:DUF2828 family protein [Cognatishimia sp.]